MSEPYTGPERRSANNGKQQVTNDDLNEALSLHALQEREAFEMMLTELIKRAFPGGPEKHYEYHDKEMKAAEAEAEFWKAAKAELTRVGISAISGVIKTVFVLGLVALAYKFGFGPLAAKLLGVS